MQRFIFYFIISILYFSCKSDRQIKALEADPLTLSWEGILSNAQGKEVVFMMWQGSPEINAYINDFVKPQLKELYNIDLKVVGGQGPEIVQLIMGERQANVADGQVDLVWINGETFFQLREIDGLWGPFVDKLPNAAYLDWANPYINTDFQQPVDGMEMPWSITQFAMIYDSAVVVDPPTTLPALSAFIKAHPGTFTISNDFTGMTLLKSFLTEISGHPEGLNGPFDEEKYLSYSQQLWAWINEHKTYFWKQGATFPTEHTKVNQLFANGELKISYGFSEGAIDEKIKQGLFTNTTRAYPWQNGTIKNTNYIGITYNSGNKSGALAVCNFLLSPAAQLEKSNPLGMNANTVLDLSKLDPEDQVKVSNLPKRRYGPSIEALTSHAIQEPDPQYMIRLYEDFRTEVIEN